MTIEVENRKNFCIIHFAYPNTNKLDFNFLNLLIEKLCEVEKETNYKVVVLKSDLDFGFSSGLDLASLFDPTHKKVFVSNVLKATSLVHKVIKIIICSKKIFIAAMSGPVIGSAASITFACDFRLAAKNSWYWLPDVQFGGLLAEGGLDILRHLIGISDAKKMALTNNRTDANAALKMGLIQELFPNEELSQKSINFATKLSMLSDESMAQTKQILNVELRKLYHKKKLRKMLNTDSTFERMKGYLKNNKSTQSI